MNIKLLNDLAKMPTKAHVTDAGWDLYSCSSYDIEIEPHKSVMIDTGVAIEIPIGYFGGIYARSGIASKRGLRPGNCVGIIDSGYINSIKVCLFNDTEKVQVVEAGERIAQLIVQPFMADDLKLVDELKDTDRGLSGFGSSGRH